MSHAVMIIDDNQLERFITETMIRNTVLPERMVSFPSAIDALAYLQSLQATSEPFPRVIFLDIHMPNMNGFEFLDKYLEFPEGLREQCKIVILSFTIVERDFDRMKKYPVIYTFVTKPMSDKKMQELSALWNTGKTK